VASIPSNLPPRGVWFRFSPRALFNDRPGWPTLRRHLPVDVRIMNTLNRLRINGATICFYQLHEIQKTSSWLQLRIPALLIVEAFDPSYDGERFLPSWLGYTPDLTLQNSSIIYVYSASRGE